MFTNKRYAQALVAFQRAGRTREVEICHAFLLRENARAVPDDQVKERADAFNEAGGAFSACANAPLSNQKRERLTYYANAGECFVQGGKLKEAGGCFVHARHYTRGARVYREGGHFDELVEVLEEYSHEIEATVLVQLKKVTQMHYFKVSKSPFAESKH